MGHPFHPLQTDETGVGAEIKKFFGTGLAVADVAQLRPFLAVIRNAQRIFLAVGIFPVQLYVAELGLSAKIDLNPGAVFERADLIRIHFAVNCHGVRQACVFQRRRSRH